MDDSPKLLTIEAVKARYGVGRPKLYYLMGEGALRAVKLGKRTLLPTADCDLYFGNLPPAGINCRRTPKAAA